MEISKQGKVSCVKSQEEILLMTYVEQKDIDKINMWFLRVWQMGEFLKLWWQIYYSWKRNTWREVNIFVSTGFFMFENWRRSCLVLDLTSMFQHKQWKVGHHEKCLIMKTNMFASQVYFTCCISANSTCIKTVTEDLFITTNFLLLFWVWLLLAATLVWEEWINCPQTPSGPSLSETIMVIGESPLTVCGILQNSSAIFVHKST